MPNPYTGRNSTGFRFCFHVTSIAQRPLFLPIEMKDLPEIQLLLKGEHPCSVFNVDSIRLARKAFAELRKQYDFPFWAACEYYIHDIKDADNIIPLILNKYQSYIIDIFQRRYHNRELGRYIITKSFGKVGVTTCVQAYILWMQIYKCCNNSYLCTNSEIAINPLKTNLCRYLKRDITPPEKYIYLPKADRRAFFNTYRCPDYIRGINLGYVHYADMSRWHDPENRFSSRVYQAATSAVLLSYHTLVVMEGNIPKEERLQIQKYKTPSLPYHERFACLTHLTNNPYFLRQVILNYVPDSKAVNFHINLNHLQGSKHRPDAFPRVCP